MKIPNKKLQNVFGKVSFYMSILSLDKTYGAFSTMFKPGWISPRLEFPCQSARESFPALGLEKRSIYKLNSSIKKKFRTK